MERLTVQLLSIQDILMDLLATEKLLPTLFKSGVKLLKGSLVPYTDPPRLVLTPPAYNRKRILHVICDMKTALLDSSTVLTKSKTTNEMYFHCRCSSHRKCR